MSKTVFIVPGFKHRPSTKCYGWMKDHFSSQGFIVKTVAIDWDRKVMSDYVEQFLMYFHENKSEENHVIGFSFGAMIALISADDLNPDGLILCSLSPYFSEDLCTLKKSWQSFMGQKRILDFANFKSNIITKQIHCKTTVIYGTAEAVMYPQLEVRCKEVAAQVKGCQLKIADGAPHQIDYPSYIETIKSVA